MAIGDVSELIAAGPARSDVTDDYCAQARPAGALTLGASEHAAGDCDTTMPPPDPDPDPPPPVDDPEAPDGGGCCGSSAAGASPLLALLVLGLVRKRRRIAGL